MPSKIKTAGVEKVRAPTYLRKAVHFCEAAADAYAHEHYDAALVLSIHAGISASDAACVGLGTRKWTSAPCAGSIVVGPSSRTSRPSPRRARRGGARRSRQWSGAVASSRSAAFCQTSRSGAGRRRRSAGSSSAATSPNCHGPCRGTLRPMPTAASRVPSSGQPTGSPPMRSSCSARRACASANSSRWSSTACTRSRVKGLAQGAARQARQRTDGAARRGDRRARRSHRRAALPGPTAATSADRPTDGVPAHAPRPTALGRGAARHALACGQGRGARPRHSAPARSHLRHRAGERRGEPAVADGPPRPRLGRDEPALWATVRRDGAHRGRARAHPRPRSASGR